MSLTTIKDPDFYDVQVLSKTRETENSFTYCFSLVDNKSDKKWRFVPGQFNILDIPGLGLYKSIITSDPDDSNTFEHTFQIDTKNTTEDEIVKGLTEGSRLKAAGPCGNGWMRINVQNKNLLMIAGGFGFRIIKPMLNYIENRRFLFSDVEVLYSVRTPKDFLYMDEYEKWQNGAITMGTIVENIPLNSSLTHRKGLIVSLLKEMKSTNENTVVLLSGSEMMLKFTINYLYSKQFKDDQIYVSLDYLINKPDYDWVQLNGPIFPLEEVKKYIL